MDSFEFNKFAGAILGTLLFVIGLGYVADMVFHVRAPEKPAFAVEVPEEAAPAAEAAAPAEAPVAIGPLLAKASVENGQAVAKKCAACHDFTKGGPNKVGPNLYGIVGSKVAHLGDAFAYSEAMKSHGGTWDYESLSGFLAGPSAYMKGTKMAFAGLKKPQDRADVIAYLRSLADTPVPLPK